MWSRILEIVFEQVAARYADTLQFRPLELSFRLLQALSGIQSEPSDSIANADRAAAEFVQEKHIFNAIAKRVSAGESVSPPETLALAYLAELRAQLLDRWKDFYRPILDCYPETGARVTQICEQIDSFPFSVGIRRVNAEMCSSNADPMIGGVAAIYVTTCANNHIFDNEAVYARVVARLAFGGEFFWTVVVAYCVKLLVDMNLVHVSNMTDEQYYCMSMIDNFHNVPGGAWG